MTSDFEWDETKARLNVLKHGVLFEEAVSVFSDPLAVILFDTEHLPDDEERFKLVGLSYRQRVLLIVHCERGEKIRIISARRATVAERREYEERE